MSDETKKGTKMGADRPRCRNGQPADPSPEEFEAHVLTYVINEHARQFIMDEFARLRASAPEPQTAGNASAPADKPREHEALRELVAAISNEVDMDACSSQLGRAMQNSHDALAAARQAIPPAPTSGSMTCQCTDEQNQTCPLHGDVTYFSRLVKEQDELIASLRAALSATSRGQQAGKGESV